MSMLSWAENEVKLKKEAERKSLKDEDSMFCGYVDGCLDSALKAYKSLTEDGHSGMSFSITRSILEQLLHEIPLTPIEDVPEVWNSCHDLYDSRSKEQHFQNSRRFSLFKDIDANGNVTYRDNDNDVLDEIHLKDGHVSCLGSNRTIKILKYFLPEALEIKFPYIPPRYPYRVKLSENLDDTSSDRDYNYLSYIQKPNFDRLTINKYVYFDKQAKLHIATDADLDMHRVKRLTEEQLEMMNK